MSINCEIKFDENPYGVYLPGQTLSGIVELRLDEAVEVRGIALQIKGVAEVSWCESSGTGSNRETIHYHGRQDYMNSTTYLAGLKDGTNINLLPGLHPYRFSCDLPANLVTSVEAKHGHIRYTVKVIVERSWKADQSYKVAFTVLRHVNLSEENFDVRLPTKTTHAKTFCCGSCRSAPMVFTAETPISGYVPGQTIAVRIEVDNQSNKTLNEIATKLLREVSFISQTPYTRVKTSTAVMAEIRCKGVEKHQKDSCVQHLLIPPLPPTNRTCQVLTVNYVLEVEGKFSGLTINPRIQVPITLGTIPLTTSAIPTFDDVPNMTATIVVQPMASTSNAQTHAIPVDLPPPSYEEATHTNRANIQEEGETNEIGCKEFSPRYIIYRFSADEPTLPEVFESKSNKQSMEVE
ncbi:arrestin domain-containing protein 3 [Aedes aegypti]|uniref:Arrestin C-terminal-like domain-containing protein n=1 Tax=Aedes aegypti TaxID=7159 RepID=A0A903VHZ6_AEDAE|nr:arrestin domain-containing protein 3 [Aedes aegypti]